MGMDQHSTDHGGGDEHAPIHHPEPSVWPLLLGISALVCGLALVWWTRDRSNSFSGPALGAAVVFLLVAIGGWAWQDGRMKRRAEQMEIETTRDARYTQVVTFAIADGRLEAAQRPDGILGAIQGSGSALRDLAGFQDLRIIASPADRGPSQVIVETTWSGRQGLATYEETRQTMLDFINEHPQDVVPGSAQIFDMQVVRDTKDMAFRFGLGPTIAMFGALIIGGFLVGAGLNIFHHESKTPATTSVPGGGTTAPSGFNGTIVGKNIKFETTSFTVPPDTKITLTFDNQDQGIPHNIHFFDGTSASAPTLTGCTSGCDKGASDVVTPIKPGVATDTFTFTTPKQEGTYYYHCDVHPTTMTGNMTVKAGAPVPGGGGGTATPGGGSATPSGSGTATPSGTGTAAPAGFTIVGKNIKFEQTAFTAPPDTRITLTFDNQDQGIPHNIRFFNGTNANAPTLTGCTSGCENGGSDVTTPIKPGPAKDTFTFTTPRQEGKYYYHCDVHPTTMTGNMTIKAGATLSGG